jgi:hypothetical protein
MVEIGWSRLRKSPKLIPIERHLHPRECPRRELVHWPVAHEVLLHTIRAVGEARAPAAVKEPAAPHHMVQPASHLLQAAGACAAREALRVDVTLVVAHAALGCLVDLEVGGATEVAGGGGRLDRLERRRAQRGLVAQDLSGGGRRTGGLSGGAEGISRMAARGAGRLSTPCWPMLGARARSRILPGAKQISRGATGAWGVRWAVRCDVRGERSGEGRAGGSPTYLVIRSVSRYRGGVRGGQAAHLLT